MSIHFKCSIKVIFIFIIELIKSRIVTAEAGFSKKNAFFTSKPDLYFRNTSKFYIWIIALYGAETWTVGKVDQIYLDSFEIRCERGMEIISWKERRITYNQGGEEYPTNKKKKGRQTRLVTFCVGTAFLDT